MLTAPKQQTLLIVDDSPEDRELYRRYLQQSSGDSYTILEASLGQQGLDRWQQHQPDIILLDYRLPDLDGLEFLSRLRSLIQQPYLPVIMVAGQGSEAIAVQAMKAGAQDYLIKEQITPEGLRLTIRGAIATVQLRTELQQRVERERVVRHITQQIHQSLDFDRILQTTVTEVRQFLNTDRVLVFQLQSDGNGTVVAESVGAAWQSLLSSTIYDPCLAENYLRFSPGSITHDLEFAEDYVKRYRQGEVTAIPDIHASDIDPCYIELLTHFQVNANLVVPILHDDRFWGLLIAHHCAASRLWQALEIDLLKELATQLRIALRQAELYQQSQSELAERNRVEATLRDSEARLRSALEASRMGTWDWNMQTGQIQWSDNLEAMFGLEPGTFDGSFEMFTRFLHPDDRDRVLATIERVIATGEDYNIEFRVVYPNGTVRWALSQGKVFYDPNGQPVRMAGNDIDITERRQSEIALRDNEQMLRLALAGAKQGIWDWNLETQILTWDTRCKEIFGLPPDFPVIYEWHLAALHPDDRPRVQRAATVALDEHTEFVEEYRTFHPNGEMHWVLARGCGFYNPTGKPYRMSGTVMDITDRKQAEDALQVSEERFRQLAENIDAVFWIKEMTDDRVSYVSSAYKRLWGLNPQNLYENQQAWIDYIHPDDRESVDRAFQAKAAAGLFDEEYRIILPNGQVRWVHDRCFPLQDEAGSLYRFTGIAEDITDRKRSEQALRESEERFRTSVENMLDCFAIYKAVRNQQGEIIDFQAEYINDAACLMSQIPREQHLSRGLCELLPTHRDIGLFDEYCQVVETGQPLVKDSLVYEDVFGEERLIKAFDIRVAKFGDGYIATWRDITKRKQTEEALRQSEEFKRRMLDSSNDCIKLLDFQGRLLYMNRGGICLLEIDDITSYLNREWTGFWQADDLQTAEAALATAKAGEVARFQGFRPTAKGTPKWWDVVVTPIFNTEGQVIQLLATSRDITDRIHSEAALRQSEDRFRTLADNMSQLAWMAHANGDIFWYNQRWFNYTGTTLTEMQGWGWQKAHHPDHVDRVVHHIRHCFETGQLWEDTFPLRGQDGQYRWFLSRAIPIRNEQGEITCWFGTNTDITDRKEYEMERDHLLAQEQVARESAERANRIKDEFLAVLSHELRSPLNPILGWTKLMQSRKFNVTKTNEALATIERNAKLQTQLIDDLLDVAKILRGKLSMNEAPVDLTFVIEAAIDTVRTAAVAKGITFHAVLPQIGRVSGDSARLQQIVWNLLSNAIKFTPTQGSVEIRLEQEGSQAKIIVSDTGKGINRNFLPHIFESFRQEDASTTRQYGGLGLGLAIVRYLVEAHGGTIDADSPGEGQGATFTVQFPLLDTESEQSSSKVISPEELDLTGIRILTIDDEPDARELLTELLTQYGAEVLTVTLATEVLTQLESFQPDVLISDIGMPEVDGYMLMQQIRALPPEKGGQVLAIALTAYAREEDYQQAIKNGYQRHLTKPLDLDQLVQVVLELARPTTGSSTEE